MRANRRRTACQNGAFYKSPAHGDKIDMGGASSSSVKIAWDTSCLNPAPEQIDIYLLSPEKAANLGQVTVWSNVPYSLGQFDVQLDSTLWGSTPSVDLQVQIIQAGTLVFLSQMAAGPVFKVVNPSPTTASASSTAALGAAVSSVTGGFKSRSPSHASCIDTFPSVPGTSSTTAPQSQSVSDIWHDYASRFANHGLSGGKLAASIVMPILVAFFAIAAYVFFSRRREARKRAAWKEETDKRMSMVSNDWQSMSAAGGAAAIRGSFHTPRGSVHTRTQSLLALDAANGGVTPSPLRTGFAAEDISQLGPRARALSAAAAGGRPLSSLVNEKAGAAPRTRSKSTAALDAVGTSFGPRANGHGRTISASAAMAPQMATMEPVPAMPRVNTGRSADDARPRTLSATSNNPFAEAMAKRDPTSAARGMAFPTFTGPSTPITDSPQPHTHVDTEGRQVDNASRARVGSRVSFADALNERRRTQSNLSKYRMMDNAGHDEYGLEMQGALRRESLLFFPPLVYMFRILTSKLHFLLLVMRTRSNELGQGGVAFPSSDGGHVLGPHAQFMSEEYSPGAGSRGSGVGSYFGSAPFAEQGESPDDALRRIAAQRRDSMRESEDSGRSGIFGSIKRGLSRFRN